jgi:hypothetical protein
MSLQGHAYFQAWREGEYTLFEFLLWMFWKEVKACVDIRRPFCIFCGIQDKRFEIFR